MTQRSMKYVDVLSSKMAYVDEGESKGGEPVVLLLHGNPTSSYLWRNVIPYLTPHARCVAPDLIGFGYSDKPDIAYRVEDHARYLQAFIEALELSEVVLILHDWGSALGLDWARRHSGQVRGLALMEFLTPMPSWLDLDAQLYEFLKAFRDPDMGRSLLIGQNAFIERGLPGGVMRQLSDAEMNEYRRPFQIPEDREPIYRFPNEVPIAGTPADVYAMATAYHAWLLETQTPKIFFHAAPGLFIPPARAGFYSEHLKACRVVDLGHGLHFLQEDHPDTIGMEIAAWLPRLTHNV
jgi:haloalkane dehalogenase